MVNNNKTIGESFYDQLTLLDGENRIPVCVRDITKQSRWQREPQSSGVYYGAPQKEEDMGRYNDASGRTGICFTADHSVTAIAESYGRQYHKKTDDFSIGSDELSRAHMCTLETTRKTKTIDMDRLLPLLHITSDKIAGDDQSITRQIVDWAANGENEFDGVTYRSRHLPVGSCTAWWCRKGEQDPLTTIEMTPVDNFHDKDKACFPNNWEYEDISGPEMITETLNFKITPNNLN